MAQDPAATSEPETEAGEVMASLDTVGADPRLIIADVTADNAWLAVSADQAVPVDDWR